MSDNTSLKSLLQKYLRNVQNPVIHFFFHNETKTNRNKLDAIRHIAEHKVAQLYVTSPIYLRKRSIIMTPPLYFSRVSIDQYLTQYFKIY